MMMRVIFLRAVLSIGGHIVWTAIVGAAIVAAKKAQPFTFKVLGNVRFIISFAIANVLHAIWDMPIPLGASVNLVQWILTAIALVIVFVWLSAGLREVNQYSKIAREKAVQNNETVNMQR